MRWIGRLVARRARERYAKERRQIVCGDVEPTFGTGEEALTTGEHEPPADELAELRAEISELRAALHVVTAVANGALGSSPGGQATAGPDVAE